MYYIYIEESFVMATTYQFFFFLLLKKIWCVSITWHPLSHNFIVFCFNIMNLSNDFIFMVGFCIRPAIHINIGHCNIFRFRGIIIKRPLQLFTDQLTKEKASKMYFRHYFQLSVSTSEFQQNLAKSPIHYTYKLRLF